MNAAIYTRTLIALPSAAAALAAAGCGNGNGGGSAGECGAELLPGDVVISEVMANPIGQSDGKEWFEIYNPGSETLDLEGAVLVNDTSGDRHVMEPFEIGPTEYAVLGNVLPEHMEAYHDYAYENDLGSLRNSGGELAIECGEEVVDHVTYPAMDEGVSMGFDGALEPDHTLNDDPSNWCPAEQEFDDDGSLGTPGEANDACGAVAQDACREDGQERDVIEPEEGDLVISEVMAQTVSEIDYLEGEWFEVYVAAEDGVDVNGLQIGRYFSDDAPEQEPGPREVGRTLGSAECLHHEEGSYIVFARSEDPELNGNLPRVDYTFAMDHPSAGITREHGGLYLAHGAEELPESGELLDTVTWPDVWPTAGRQNQDGFSLSLDPDHLDPDDNNDLDNWCFSSDRFSEFGGGTPGAPNATCSPGGPCTDPDSGEVRESEPPEEGDLVITEVMANNQDGVHHGRGGWFEIHVQNDVDLNALQLGHYDEEEGEPEEVEMALNFRDCQRHDADSQLLFAMIDDEGDRDPLIDLEEIEVDYEFNFGWSQFSSSGDGIFLTFDGDLDDPLEYTFWNSASTSGVSLNLDPDEANPEGSADPDNWCRATDADEDLEPYFCCGPDEDQACPDPDDGEGEGCSFGTPGDENPSCD